MWFLATVVKRNSGSVKGAHDGRLFRASYSHIDNVGKKKIERCTKDDVVAQATAPRRENVPRHILCIQENTIYRMRTK